MNRLALLCILVGGMLRADELPARVVHRFNDQLLTSLKPQGLGGELPTGAVHRFSVRDEIPNHPILMLGFRANGESLVTASHEGWLSWWNLGGWGEKREGYRFSIQAAALAADRSCVAFTQGAEVLVHRTSKSESMAEIISPGATTTLALSPNGSTLVIGKDDHTVEVWDTKANRLVHTLRGHAAYVSSSAFSPSGKLLATGAHDRTIRLWDPVAGKLLRVLEGHRDQVSGLVFLPDNRTLVSASWDRAIRLWDVETGKEKHCLHGHRLEITAVATDSKGSKLASVSLDGTARVWDLATRKGALRIEVSADGVSAVALSPDGSLLAAGDRSGTVTVWDGKGKRVNRLASPKEEAPSSTQYACCVALSPDGSRIVSGHSDSGIRLWDTASGKMIRRVGRMTDWVRSVAFSPDGKQVASAGRRNGAVNIWDADKGELVKSLPGETGDISRILYSRNGKRLIAAGSSSAPVIYVWDVEREKVIHRLEGHRNYIDSLALSPDEKTLASASRDGTLRLWDLATGKETKQLGDTDFDVAVIAFSPDGQTLAARSTRNCVHLWDPATGNLRTRLKTGPSIVMSLAYSRDGRTLLIGTTTSLLLLDVLTQTERCRLTDPLAHVLGIAFSPDGRRIVTAGQGNSITLWDSTGLGAPGRKKVALTAEDLTRNWEQLSGAADRAYEAIWKLSAAPEQSLPWFAKHLQPVQGADPKQVERWVAELASDRFKIRDRAEKELKKLDDLAQIALERACRSTGTLDQRRRIEHLLERIASLSATPDMLRQLRMVETLEIIGNAEARRLLERLATGEPGARLTREAKATLARLDTR